MARPAKQLSISAFDKAVAKATQGLVNRLSTQYTAEISADKWVWVDGLPRDIVDTDRLRASQTVRRLSATEYEVSWPVEYALQNHEGGKFFDGRDWPARPWTKTALENFDAKTYFETILRRELNG